ncbi:MAG: hypothetical protein KDA81_00975 [Planctomycetaceae bacterium]|nr:hypothetical protein [Planctomycetaceae bacterium]
MSKDANSEQLRLGFMAAVEVDGRGFVGGLLVTNHMGRPLEFQCTTPVRPDRTQEILYGRTLKSWLLGELIGRTLLERVSIKPEMVFVADPALLEVRDHTEIPVACMDADGKASSREALSAELGGRRLCFHDQHPDDARFVTKKSHLVPGQADLEEPLERVRDALNETIKTVMAR